MFNDSDFPIIVFLPYALTALLLVWSLIKKEKWFLPTIMSLSFSSSTFFFMLVGEEASKQGHFQVGFSIGMYASLVATIPLAWFGWVLAKKFKPIFSAVMIVVALLFNYGVSHAYQYKIKQNALSLKTEVVFDCAKLPYHCAIRENQIEEIPKLKQNGFNIEARDSLSRSALWYGIENEHAVIALLESGANPDGFNMKQETPLGYVMVLSLKPNLNIAKLLIKYGANINRTIGFRKNISILNFAIINGHKDVILFALENGADTKYIDGYKKTACQRFLKMPKEQTLDYKKYCPEL